MFIRENNLWRRKKVIVLRYSAGEGGTHYRSKGNCRMMIVEVERGVESLASWSTIIVT